MKKMEVIFGLLCLVYCFLPVSCDDSTMDPNRIPGVVTKTDNSDVTVGIALGVGTVLLLVAFLAVVLYNKCKKRKEGNRETVIEDGQLTAHANGNNNADNKNLIPLHDVNTISVHDDVPNTEHQAVVRENVEEVNSALVTSDISRHDHQADAQHRAEDVHSAAVTELEEARPEDNQSEARNTNSLVSVAAVGGAVVGGASLIGGASLLNSNDSDPDLQTRIEDTIDNEVIENVPETLEQEISDNQFVSSAFVAGADHDSDHNSNNDSDKESERAFEDAEDPYIPAPPPPSVDYVERVEQELAEMAHDNEFPNPPDVIPTEDDTREFFEDRVIADHSQIDDADDFQPSNTIDSDSYGNTDQVHYDRDHDEVPTLPTDHYETTSEQVAAYNYQADDRDLSDEEPTLPSENYETASVQAAARDFQAYDRDLSDKEPSLPSETSSVQAADYDLRGDDRDVSDEVPSLPSDHHETSSVPPSDYGHQANARDPVKHATSKFTTFSADSSQSEYLRSFAPAPLDMDHIIIVSKD